MNGTFEVRGPLVYADADIAAGIADAKEGSPSLVISTGGHRGFPHGCHPGSYPGSLDP